MADQAAEEQLLDVRIAEASAGYKFYLNNEKLILGSSAVILFMLAWETVGNWAGMINPMFMKSITTYILAGLSSPGVISSLSFSLSHSAFRSAGTRGLRTFATRSSTR